MKVAVNGTNSALGFAWVTMPDDASARKALSAFSNGANLRIHASRLEYEDVRIVASRPLGAVDRLFCDLSRSLRERIQLDNVAAFSVTEMRVADKISQLLLSMASCGGVDVANDGIKIIDAFSCIGGNVLSFCKFFDHVVAIELDPERFKMLRHNVEVVWAEWTSGTMRQMHCADCIDVLSRDNVCASIVFLDPPWGGMTYSKEESIEDFYISGKRSLREFVQGLGARFPIVALRLPVNYDVTSLAADMVTLEMSNESGSRPLPFRLNLGTKALMLIVAFPPYLGSTCSSSLLFGDKRLDELIRVIHEFDKRVMKKEENPSFSISKHRKDEEPGLGPALGMGASVDFGNFFNYHFATQRIRIAHYKITYLLYRWNCSLVSPILLLALCPRLKRQDLCEIPSRQLSSRRP